MSAASASVSAPAADFDDAVLGHGLPPAAESALKEAGRLRGSDAPLAMAALMRAQALAPDHPAVLIALYRHHFYGHRLAPARDIARRALRRGAQALGLPLHWREVPRAPLGRAHHDPRHDPSLRFYLFALKGYAYLSLRLGDEREAAAALALLRHLDPQDCVGAALLEDVRQRRARAQAGLDDEGADDDRPAPAAVFGAAAWARLDASAEEAPR
jgi:hypothetical protein